jgi:hypothetical protein
MGFAERLIVGAAVSPRYLEYNPYAKPFGGKPTAGQLVVAPAEVEAYAWFCDGIAAARLAGRRLGLPGRIHP